MAIGRPSERALNADLAMLMSRRAEIEAEQRDALARQQTVRARALRDELARIARRHGELLRELPRYATGAAGGAAWEADLARPPSA